MSPIVVDEIPTARVDYTSGFFVGEIAAPGRRIHGTEWDTLEDPAIYDAQATVENAYRGRVAVVTRCIEVKPSGGEHER